MDGTVLMATTTALLARLEAATQLLEHRPRRPLPVPVRDCERATPNSEQGRVRMVPPAEIAIDPARFQFRLSPAVDGTTGRLEGCPSFRVELSGSLLVWLDDGQLWLIDGHHRRRLALEDHAPLVPVLLVDAADAAAARAWGALSNVAAGHATATDLCRLLRDQDLDPKTLARTFGIQRNSKVVADARALLALAPDLFGLACTGQMGHDHSLALATAGDDHALQRRLWSMTTTRGWDAQQLVEAVALAQLAPRQASQGGIPGLGEALEEANPNLDAVLAVLAQIRQGLRVESRAMKMVSQRTAAAALERRGVVQGVDRAAARDARQDAEAVLALYGRVAGCSGPLAELVAQLAQRVADGADVRRLVESKMDEVRRVLSSELG
jgi:hypothetical protein